MPRTHNKLGDRSFSAAGPRLSSAGLRQPGLSFDSFRRSLHENTPLWRLKRLVTLSTYRRYINKCIYLSIYQSAYHAGHAIETALLQVFNRVLSAASDKKLMVLVAVVGLDISPAFDMINHIIPLCRLHGEFGVTGTALAWLQSCISNRFQFIKLGRHSSAPVSCSSGVPHGFVLGPILFATYTSPTGNLIRSFGIYHHQFANDTQVQLALLSSDQSINQSIVDLYSA